MKNIFICLVLIVFLSACQKGSTISKISGSFYRDCQTPLKHVELGLKSSSINQNNEPLILGSAITDEEGSFDLTYELEDEEGGDAELILFRKNGYETIVENLPLGRNLNLELYLNNISPILLYFKTNQTISATDTLFYGIGNIGLDTFVVQPQIGLLDSIVATVPNSVDGNYPATLSYGVGTTEYQKSKTAEGIKDSTFQNITLNLKGCPTIVSDTIQID